MNSYSNRAMRDMTEPATAAFEFWISFWPVAPVFGVEWRFAEIAEKMTGGVPLTASTIHSGARMQPKAQAKPKKAESRSVRGAVEKIVKRAVETPMMASPVDDAALKPKVENAETAIEEVMEAAVPLSQTKTETKAEPKSETKSETKAEPKSETKTEPKSETKTEPKNETNAKTDQASLDLAADEAASSKPASLMKSAPKNADDLKLIKGIGPGLEKQLNGLGIYTFRQIAGFSEADLTWVDDSLTAFKGRCFRDDWTGQAKAQLD